MRSPPALSSSYDGDTPLTTAAASGCVYWWATPSLQVGAHPLTAVYNDANNKNVTSAPFTVTVSRGDVSSEIHCWNANFAYGYDYQCANNCRRVSCDDVPIPKRRNRAITVFFLLTIK